MVRRPGAPAAQRPDIPRTRSDLGAGRRLRVSDIVLVAAYAFGGLGLVAWQAFYARVPPSQLAPDVAALVLGAVAIALRRSRLVVALPVAAVALAAAIPLQQPVDLVVLAVVIYSATAWWSLRTGAVVWVALSIVAAAGATVLRLTVLEPPRVGRWQIDLLLILGVGLAAFLAGGAVGARRRYVASLVELTNKLAAERDRSAQLAASAERARIARDVHDILSHGLQVIVSSSDAATAVIGRNPDQARALLETISDAGRQSMREARTVFTLLHGTEGDSPGDSTVASASASAPQPTLESLAALVDRFRSAGLDVELSEEGHAALDATGQLVVVRVVQEALTNTLRHGGSGARAEVRISHDAAGSTLDVVDDGPAPGRAAADTRGSGLGVEGMRQRVDVVGGTFGAGRRVDAPGWRVHATVPAVASTAGPRAPTTPVPGAMEDDQ